MLVWMSDLSSSSRRAILWPRSPPRALTSSTHSLMELTCRPAGSAYCPVSEIAPPTSTSLFGRWPARAGTTPSARRATRAPARVGVERMKVSSLGSKCGTPHCTGHSTCQTTGMWEDRGEKRVLGARQEHGEAAPLPFARLGGHAPAVGVHDAAHDRQAKARAAPLAVGLAVGVEDVRQRVGGDADARVLDLELELRARVDQPHDDVPPARAEADPLGAEVDYHLVEPFRVAEVREVRSEPLALEGDARRLGLRVDLLDGAVHEPCEVEWSAVELHEPRPQARQREDLIDEPEQPLGAQPDDVREASLSLRERAGGAVAEKLDRAVDRRKRRPELVRDAREELGLRLPHPAELARHRG